METSADSADRNSIDAKPGSRNQFQSFVLHHPENKHDVEPIRNTRLLVLITVISLGAFAYPLSFTEPRRQDSMLYLYSAIPAIMAFISCLWYIPFSGNKAGIMSEVLLVVTLLTLFGIAGMISVFGRYALFSLLVVPFIYAGAFAGSGCALALHVLIGTDKQR